MSEMWGSKYHFFICKGLCLIQQLVATVKAVMIALLLRHKLYHVRTVGWKGGSVSKCLDDCLIASRSTLWYKVLCLCVFLVKLYISLSKLSFA